MKTSLTVLSLVFAAAVPSSFAAEFAGVQLPAALEPSTAFGAFFVTAMALIAFADYGRSARARLAKTGTSRTSRDLAVHPLAA